MKTAAIIEHLKRALQLHPEVVFAYIHGSILSSDKPQDIDVAVFLYPAKYEELFSDGEVNIGFAIPLEMELEKQLDKKVDLQVLNGAPLSFRYHVVNCGILIIENNSNIRFDFEYLSRVEYFDFRPRREEYLREVMT